ncbi:MAG: DUF4352 domain-containing protein [Actinomycetia bacterium]|nr:DUF4352 domain-containing protein [Actinomycetes bacterium]
MSDHPHQHDPQHNPQHHPQQQGGPQWAPTEPPPPPAPPAKEKSWFARHKILTAILALLLLGVIVNALGGEGDEDSRATSTPTTASTATTEETEAADEETPEEAPAEEPAEEAEAAADLPGIGDPVRDGKFEFVVTGVEDGGTEIGSEYFGEEAQGRFHLVHITVTNIGTEAQGMFSGNQKVKDEQGRTFESNSSAVILMDDNDLWITDINPGNSLSGTLIFDMPEGATPVEIELHDSAFSGGVSVALN